MDVVLSSVVQTLYLMHRNIDTRCTRVPIGIRSEVPNSVPESRNRGTAVENYDSVTTKEPIASGRALTLTGPSTCYSARAFPV
jgi:hypothetical protein